MAYKRKESPYYQIRRKRLPGYGDTGVLSSGLKSKRSAEAAERTLEEIAEWALLDAKWTNLLDAVCKSKRITIAQLLQARRDRRLERLCASLSDPLIADVIARLRTRGIDASHRQGFELLERLMPAQARLTYLDAKRITALCHQAEAEGRKRNSVRRTLHRAISTLLREEFGRSERNRSSMMSSMQPSATAETSTCRQAKRRPWCVMH